MNLEQVLKQVLTLIEEYDEENDTDLTNDPDIANKIKHCIDNIQVELSTIKRIKNKVEFDTTKTNVMAKPSDLYKIDKVKECDFEVIGNEIIFDKNYTGIVTMIYDKYPKKIGEETSLDEELELSRDALECLVYGVASAILKADISANYSVYEYKYQELKEKLNNANTNGFVWVE
jgi:hypothetical protein